MARPCRSGASNCIKPLPKPCWRAATRSRAFPNSTRTRRSSAWATSPSRCRASVTISPTAPRSRTLFARPSSPSGRIILDDEFLRRVFVGYLAGSGEPQDREQAAAFTLETLDLSAEQRALLQEGMMLAGATDLLSFL